MRLWVALAAVTVALAGCTAILGVDRDYTVGPIGGGGTLSTTSSDGAGGTGAGGTGAGGIGAGGTGAGGTGAGGTGAGGTGAGGTGAGGTGAGGTGAGGTGAGGTHQVVFQATIADCIDTTAPDPDACAAPANALWIDQTDDTRAYLRFEPDGTTAGSTIVSATLQLTVGSYSQAQGDTSGELWEVAAFARADLFAAAPVTVGNVLAPNQGAANPAAVLSWPVPPTLIQANTPVHLGLFPVSFNSVGYLNLNGVAPPRLVVVYQ